MKLAWATDIHLDSVQDLTANMQTLSSQLNEFDSIVITGDISTANTILDHLKILDNFLKKPSYFVLGNHDYYYSDIISTRRKVVELCLGTKFVKYLGGIPFVKLDKRTAMVGHDCWYDALNGDPGGSEIVMNDWLKIKDFQPALQKTNQGIMIEKGMVSMIAQAINRASTKHILEGINEAIKECSHVVIATHVPPFKESYTKEKYKDIATDYVLPWYTSKSTGNMLLSVAKTYPKIKFTVLSGHTHSPFEGSILRNLHVKVGKSQYGTPQIAGCINT